jgi:hypothetical protein
LNGQLLELFTGIKSVTDVKARFVTRQQPETNHVEFKEKSDRRIPDLSEYDKTNFAKALSSFSNAEGGILIWGIKTRKRDGQDYAAVLKSITQVEAFAERLRDSLINILMPQNPGVRIEAVRNRLGNGYVKCFIPASDNPPHRSMQDREYWVRLDGRSVKLEHYLIRDMMARHAYPDLDADLVPDYRQFPSGRVRVGIFLHNKGRAIAKYSGWFAFFYNAKILAYAPGIIDSTDANSGQQAAGWGAPAGTVIHPNNIRSQVGWIVLESTGDNLRIVINLRWYCEDMSMKERGFSIAATDSGSDNSGSTWPHLPLTGLSEG